MNDLPLIEGAGFFVFPDRAAGLRQSLRVFYVRPASFDRVVIAMHGLDRAASEFRDGWRDHAERLGLLVMVPEFDVEAFPDAYSYNYGNVRRPGAEFRPRDLWNFGIIDRLFEQVRAALRFQREKFSFFGLSAGAQYVQRYLALTGAPFVDLAICCNCGWYMVPDLTRDYPVGMSGLDLDETSIRYYLEKRMIVLLGSADCDPAAPDLPRGGAAAAQGPNRLLRGLWHFNYCRVLATRLGGNFGWELQIAPGLGHVHPELHSIAATMIAASS